MNRPGIRHRAATSPLCKYEGERGSMFAPRNCHALLACFPYKSERTGNFFQSLLLVSNTNDNHLHFLIKIIIEILNTNYKMQSTSELCLRINFTVLVNPQSRSYQRNETSRAKEWLKGRPKKFLLKRAPQKTGNVQISPAVCVANT